MPVTVLSNQLSDCVFRGDSATGTWSQLATDDSGVATNWTAAVGYMHTTDTTGYLTHRTRKTVDMRFSAVNATTGYLYAHRTSGGTIRQVLRISSTTPGLLEPFWNGAALTNRQTTVWPAGGTPNTMVITWTFEPYRLTTGSSDELRHEIQVFNATAGTYEQFVFFTATMSDPAANATHTFGALNPAGGTLFTGTMLECRISKQFHSSVETRETYIDTSAAPTLLGTDRMEPAMPTVASGLGNNEEFGGPVYALAARSIAQGRQLLWGPIVNELIKSAEWRDNADGASTDWAWEPNGTGEDEVYLDLLYRRPVPLEATRLHCRVFVQTDWASGIGSAQQLAVRVWSMSQPGPYHRPSTSPTEFERYYVESTLTADHGTTLTAGAWLDLGLTRIARDNEGHTYLAVSIDFPASATQDVRIRAVVIEPVHYVSEDEAPVNGWGSG